MARRSNKIRNATDLYKMAECYTRAAGFGWEADWQRSRVFGDFSERDLLRETAWVIMCSGFRESTVRCCFGYISLCFCDWESAREIARHRRACIDTAAARFQNYRKLNAIVNVADTICEAGFSRLQSRIHREPIVELQQFPFVGPTTSWHLAKNLGLNVAKNDRHLAKFAEQYGFSSAHTLCQVIADMTGEPKSVVDIVLWRFATLFSGPQSVRRS